MLNHRVLTGRLACWMLQLKEFDFKIICHPKLYYQAAEAMSRLYKRGGNSLYNKNDVDGVLLVYLIMGQASALCSLINGGYSTASDRPKSKEIFGR